jgi:hypothetical protein
VLFDLDGTLTLKSLVEDFYVELKLPIITNVAFLGLGKNRK